MMQRVFPPPQKTVREGVKRRAGRVSFATFLCPPKKSRREEADGNQFVNADKPFFAQV
jgi:hypothetical protein